MELVVPCPEAQVLEDSRREGPLRIAVISGKGGAGKTTVAANLAVAIAAMRRGVLLLDCDLSAGQAHLFLGLSPSAGLAQVVRGEKKLRQVLLAPRQDLYFAPGGPPDGGWPEINGSEVSELLTQAQTTVASSGTVVLDTGPSRISAASGFAQAVDIPLVISTPEPTSVRATVAVLEAICCRCPRAKPGLLINMASSDDEAQATFHKVKRAILPPIMDSLNYMGALPFDTGVPASLREAAPFVVAASQSRVSQSLRALADSLCQMGTDKQKAGISPCCASEGPGQVEGSPRAKAGDREECDPRGSDGPGLADDDEEEAGHPRAA